MLSFPSSTLEFVLSYFEGVKRIGSGYVAKCPAHRDNTPSLGIDVSDRGAILLKCRSGCEQDAVLRAAGLEGRDLFPQRYHVPTARAAARPSGTLSRALELWDAAVPAAGTGAERYLRSRGITHGFDRVRFHPRSSPP